MKSGLGDKSKTELFKHLKPGRQALYFEELKGQLDRRFLLQLQGCSIALVLDSAALTLSSLVRKEAIASLLRKRTNELAILGATTLQFGKYYHQTFWWCLENATGWVVGVVAQISMESKVESFIRKNKKLHQQYALSFPLVEAEVSYKLATKTDDQKVQSTGYVGFTLLRLGEYRGSSPPRTKKSTKDYARKDEERGLKTLPPEDHVCVSKALFTDSGKLKSDLHSMCLAVHVASCTCVASTRSCNASLIRLMTTIWGWSTLSAVGATRSRQGGVELDQLGYVERRHFPAALSYDLGLDKKILLRPTEIFWTGYTDISQGDSDVRAPATEGEGLRARAQGLSRNTRQLACLSPILYVDQDCCGKFHVRAKELFPE
ncbi:hypothetical protein EGW08_007618 [Elysia chlorotica]|uniref:Uncharacterized protein n=1 Tax=Elysia chlorotica TaxID=188477 RepID=A0A3S1C6W3_ELYCH|nr:hypothetical protein EGW08_007618 [Elysia chlorotica]